MLDQMPSQKSIQVEMGQYVNNLLQQGHCSLCCGHA